MRVRRIHRALLCTTRIAILSTTNSIPYRRRGIRTTSPKMHSRTKQKQLHNSLTITSLYIHYPKIPSHIHPSTQQLHPSYMPLTLSSPPDSAAHPPRAPQAPQSHSAVHRTGFRLPRLRQTGRRLKTRLGLLRRPG